MFEPGELPADVHREHLLSWIAQSRKLISYAEAQIKRSNVPEFWQGVVSDEQERIKDLTRKLIEVKRHE